MYGGGNFKKMAEQVKTPNKLVAMHLPTHAYFSIVRHAKVDVCEEVTRKSSLDVLQVTVPLQPTLQFAQIKQMNM